MTLNALEQALNREVSRTVAITEKKLQTATHAGSFLISRRRGTEKMIRIVIEAMRTGDRFSYVKFVFY